MKLRKSLSLFLVFWLISLAGCYRREVKEVKEAKVLLIGIDGATWKLINPMIEDGKLPNFDKIRRKGVYARIKSLDGLISPIIWTSVVTGKNLDKHNIRAWSLFDERLNKETPYRSYHRRTKAIWNILSENGKRVGIFNWLITWPPEKVNGFMVSSYYLSKSSDLITTYPSSLHNFLPITPYRKKETIQSKWDKKVDYCEYELSMDIENSLFLQQREPLTLSAVYTRMPDEVQHLFWKFMEPEYFSDKVWNLDDTDIAEYKNVIRDCYQKVDNWLGQLTKNIDKDTIVIILSDHGFKHVESLYVPLNFNEILKKVGLSDQMRVYWCWDGRDWTYISSDAPKNKVVSLIAGIRTLNGKSIYKIMVSDKKGYDIALTQVQSNLNLDEDIYIGEKRYKVEEFVTQKFRTDISGAHDYEDGIFIICGRQIPKGKKITGASVLDITPTILYLLGLPVAKDMDGKVLTQAIQPSFLKTNPIQYIESYDQEGKAPFGPQEPTTIPYDEKLLERLKSLGYIE